MVTKSSKKSGKKASKSTKSVAAKKKASKKAAPNAGNDGTAVPASFRKTGVSRNGLRSFAFHRGDKGSAAVIGAIKPQVTARPGAAASAAPARGNVTSMDAETC